MNVSHKYKVIWWAPERTATKLLTQIFKHFEFEYPENKKKNKKLGEPYHSHELGIPEGCEDYQIICSVRNPYDRVLSLYKNFTTVGLNALYTRDTKSDFVKRFDHFIKELYIYAIEQKKIENLEREVPVRNLISKMNFTTTIPNHIIRMENLVDDLEKIDFVRDSEMWKSGSFHELIQNNPFIRRKPYGYNEVYTFGSAKKVYDFQKKLFFICGYDPFSFTTETLDEDMKRQFLHETF